MENLNLVELLRDCPTGIELDSTVFDNITFDYVNTQQNRVYCKVGKSESVWFTPKGGVNLLPDAKCVIFPKGKTTWEGFVPPCKFKIEKGKWYVCTRDLLDNYANKAFRKGDTYLSTQDGSLIPSNSNVPFKVVCSDTYFRDWTIEDAKEGDVLYVDCTDENDNKQYDYIFILDKNYNGKVYSYCFYYITDDEFRPSLPAGTHLIDGKYPIRLATEEEKQKLFDAIKANGYKWNTETKTLEKLIKPKFKVGDRIRHKETNKDDVYEISKVYDDSYGLVGFTWMIYMKYQDQYELVPNKFDITTLKAFDKVLVRNTNSELWRISLFGCFSNEERYFMCMANSAFYQCIPYNEDTKHLVGTTNDCDDFYKTWEK